MESFPRGIEVSALHTRCELPGVVGGSTDTTKAVSWDPVPSSHPIVPSDTILLPNAGVFMTLSLKSDLSAFVQEKIVEIIGAALLRDRPPDDVDDSEDVTDVFYTKKFVGLMRSNVQGDIYMDSGSQCNVTPFRHMLKNIKVADSPLRIHGVVDGSTTSATEVGFIGSLMFYYCKDVPVTIISLSQCTRKFRVRFDNAYRDAFDMFTEKGIYRFVNKNGCYIYNVNDPLLPYEESDNIVMALTTSGNSSGRSITKIPINPPFKFRKVSDHGVEESIIDANQVATTHVSLDDVTTKQFIDKLSDTDKKKMGLVYDIFVRLGFPGIATFRKILAEGNYPKFTARDWDNYIRVYGIPAAVIKGRMVRHAPPAIGLIDLAIKHSGKFVVLYGDLMFICDFIYMYDHHIRCDGLHYDHWYRVKEPQGTECGYQGSDRSVYRFRLYCD